jgi:transposase-like protein
MGRSTSQETLLSDKRKYRKFTSKQKVELVLASFRGDRSVAEICREHDLSETLLRRWRDQMIDAGAERFTDGVDRSVQAEQRRRIAELERALGKKTYELEISGKLLRDYSQPGWRAANERHGVLTQSWSPIGGSYICGDAETNPLEDPVIGEIAARHAKAPVQVVLRWHLDHGFSAIPKSVKAHRIAENFDVVDFALTADEVAAIDRLDAGVRGRPDPDSLSLQNYGFAIPD